MNRKGTHFEYRFEAREKFDSLSLEGTAAKTSHPEHDEQEQEEHPAEHPRARRRSARPCGVASRQFST